ncbi:HepT-like ribonuclease domain-containing protein [Deinococcus ruber]|uniref:HepT-like ribonuclease domain-containing protein n=1 Tax=Deinococcus ruber TaxID=1848197 RepID=UPI001E36F9F1|nr:HepT-like ribonuclease domain-containing protein [Deinococcus ruber]
MPNADTLPPDPPRLFEQPRLQDVSRYLKAHEAEWRALGVSRVRVFGSVARGEAHEASDVDLLVDLAAGSDLLALVRATWLFESLLGRRTDVVTEAALHPMLRAGVLADAVDILDDTSPPAPHDLPRKRWRWRVQALLALLEHSQKLLEGLDFAAFQANTAVQDSVLLTLLRLGEGTKFVPQPIQDAHPDVPWNELRSVRNLIAHDYFGLDLGLIWQTLSVTLPTLYGPLRAVQDDPALTDSIPTPEAP